MGLIDSIFGTHYALITIKDTPCLFSNCRLRNIDEVADGKLFQYQLREDGNGNPCEIRNHVTVNHWGDVLSKYPIAESELTSDDINFDGFEMTVKEYLNSLYV